MGREGNFLMVKKLGRRIKKFLKNEGKMEKKNFQRRKFD
jgi:hypothetical protein